MSSKQTSWYSNVNPNVFLSTVILIGVFLVIVILAPNSFDLITKQLNQWVTENNIQPTPSLQVFLDHYNNETYENECQKVSHKND